MSDLVKLNKNNWVIRDRIGRISIEVSWLPVSANTSQPQYHMSVFDQNDRILICRTFEAREAAEAAAQAIVDPRGTESLSSKLEEQLADKCRLVDALESKINTLEGKLATARAVADLLRPRAERYNFLREGDYSYEDEATLYGRYGYLLMGEELDDAIDALRRRV